jgi:surfactin synthase thioesterase subunit
MTAPRRPPRWWLHEPAREVAGRVFLLPYSGCGASMYRRWPRFLDDVELVAIQLPGRENRMRERPHETYQALAADVISALDGYLDRPFGFFGHCGSALSSYEIAVQLCAAGGPQPACVFASSQVAPQDGPYGTYLSMNDAELGVEVARLIRYMGGDPRPDLVELCLGVMRADVDANARYVMPEPVRLPCRVSAIGWRDDVNIRPDQMTGWTECGQTVTRLLEGDHFAFLSCPPDLQAVLHDDLLGATRGTVESHR